MERLPRGKYTKEFREEAVKLVMQGGLSTPEASRRLSLSSTVADNVLKQDFSTTAPNQVWVTDLSAP